MNVNEFYDRVIGALSPGESAENVNDYYDKYVAAMSLVGTNNRFSGVSVSANNNITSGSGANVYYQWNPALSAVDTHYDTDRYVRAEVDATRFYAPVDGYYQIEHFFTWGIDDVNTNGYRAIGHTEWVNGVEVGRTLIRQAPLIGAELAQACSTIVKLNKDQGIRVFSHQTSGVFLPVVGNGRGVRMYLVKAI